MLLTEPCDNASLFDFYCRGGKLVPPHRAKRLKDLMGSLCATHSIMLGTQL